MFIKKYATFSIEAESPINRLSLPHHWHTNPNETWTISIVNGVIYPSEHISTGILRIDLDELSGIDQYSETSKTLAILYSHRSEAFFIDPKHILSHQLNETTVNVLTLRFMTENGQVVTPRKHSYITFCLENMQHGERERTLFLSAQAPDDGTEIICQLPHPVHLEQRGSWQLCLHSIVMPNMRILLDDDDQYTIEVTVGEENEIKRQQKIAVKKYVTGSNIEYFLSDIEFVLATYLREPDLREPTISFSKDGDHRLKIKVRKRTRIAFSRSLAFALGLLETGDERRLITIEITPKTPHHCSKPIDFLRVPPQRAYLECGIIEPSIHNKQFQSTLKVLPIDFTNAKNRVYYEFTHLEYHDISTSTLQNLKFRFVDEKNHPIEFSPDNNNVKMTLLLRQIH